MKFINLAALATTISLIGCSTTGSNNILEQTAVTDAAYFGTIYELQQNPGARPALQVAQVALQAESTGSNPIPVSAIEAIVDNSLGSSTNVNNAITQAAINTGLTLAFATLEGAATNSVTGNQTVQQVSGWLATGISEGLGTAPAAYGVVLNRKK